MEERIALLCNPSAENARALRMTEAIGLLLQRRGYAFTAFTERWPTDLDGFTQAWIVGGDGTLNWFINHYPGCQLPLAAFPGGTANDFHWTLFTDGQMDLSAEALAERFLAGNTVPVDGGTCNGRPFLNGVGIGFDGAIVRDLLGKKKVAGKASYLLSVLKHILVYQEKPISLRGPGLEWSDDCLLLSVANGKRFGGDFLVAPAAVLDDGLLDLNFVGRIAPLQRMRYLPVIEKGGHGALPFVWQGRVGEVLVTCPQPLHAHLDGEYLYADRFDIRCLPKRYRFFV